jgi:hypothetical protein
VFASTDDAGIPIGLVFILIILDVEMTTVPQSPAHLSSPIIRIYTPAIRSKNHVHGSCFSSRIVSPFVKCITYSVPCRARKNKGIRTHVTRVVVIDSINFYNSLFVWKLISVDIFALLVFASMENAMIGVELRI